MSSIKNHDNDSKNLASASLSSASSLIGLQLFSRLFTFALNQALVRLASPAAFGAAAIQFELILSTILFLSREGIRNALLRVPANDTLSSRRKRANLALLPVFLGIPLALATSCAYTFLASDEVKSQPHFHLAIALYVVAAVLELASEPLYNRAMTELKTNVRVRAEGLAITIKSFGTVAVLVYDPKDLALVAFAVGQLAYGAVLLQAYLFHLGPEGTKIQPPTSKDTGYFNNIILRLAFTMSSQSIVKHFLTEGDKLILSWFSPLQDQGGYAIAVNYGSLIARIVFQPIEESLRLFFSRSLAEVLSTSPAQSSKTTSKSSQRQAVEQSATTLEALLTIQTAFSVILSVFGALYLPILVPMLLPPRYISTSAPSVLAAWVWYIPVLAINGGLEAFLSSVATPKDLNSQSRWMALFSLVYISSSILFYNLKLGDASLVYANIINLLCRIAYCLNFASTFFQRNQTVLSIKSALPSFSLVALVAFSVPIIKYSERRFEPSQIALQFGKRALFHIPFIAHIGLGGALALACFSTWWLSSGRHLRACLRHRAKTE